MVSLKMIMLWKCVSMGKTHTNDQIKIVLFLTVHAINMMAYFLAIWLFHYYKKLIVYKNKIHTFSTSTVMNKKT